MALITGSSHVMIGQAARPVHNPGFWGAYTGDGARLAAGRQRPRGAKFRNGYYRVWTSTDFVGCEVCAAVKNCYAFGGGFMDGLLDREGKSGSKYRRYNYGAALFGQATRELGQWMTLLGGRTETSHGLSGVGDMFVTTMGGRNVKAGRLVGAGIPFSEVRDEKMRGVTLEGVAAIEVIGGALPKLTDRGIIAPEDFPLMRHLHAVVADDEPVDIP